MRSFLPAMALCAVLQPALAGSTAPAHLAAPAPVVMHTSLAATPAVGSAAGTSGGGAPVVVAGFKGDAPLGAPGAPKAPEQEERQPTTSALLLTALAVMSGIALRRWGMGGA